MKSLLLLVFPLLLNAESLKSLLEYAQVNNELVVSQKYIEHSKQKELDAAQSNYYPTIDAALFYQREDDATPFLPGTTYGASLKVGFDVYDGGKKSYTLKQKSNEHSSAIFTYSDTKKFITFAIVQDFYNIKSLEATLDAREEAAKVLEAQLERIVRFYDAKLATSDDVDRLQSAYDSNIYTIDSLKFEILSKKSELELKVGRKIDSLDDSKFKKTLTQESDELDSILALRANKAALNSLSQTVDSYYYPNVKIEDTYSLYGYQDEPSYAGQQIPQLDNQNKIMATLNMRLVDFGTIREQKAAITLQAAALNEQIKYKSKEQKMQLSLALRRIQTTYLNIKSTQSALKSSRSALKTITKKYNAGIVDNVVYLDALSSLTKAKALNEKSINDLEIAYSMYYYYNSKNIEEFLNE
ncbi:TolC family protein [Sulfurimonas sp. SAG-AH-194-L11]|nr:TolC family protein [Sulfurimonas sp. SAG-AH-194-L11]MDF1877143.1 TolC family protein [Sulfurimonas sp. SAG-AH-194-L11]